MNSSMTFENFRGKITSPLKSKILGVQLPPEIWEFREVQLWAQSISPGVPPSWGFAILAPRGGVNLPQNGGSRKSRPREFEYSNWICGSTRKFHISSSWGRKFLKNTILKSWDSPLFSFGKIGTWGRFFLEIWRNVGRAFFGPENSCQSPDFA